MLVDVAQPQAGEPAAALPVGAPDYAAFLLAQLHQSSTALVARHDWMGQRLWVKRAGPPHPAWRYRVLAALAHTTGVPVLQPVPNAGGRVAIATEVQRLRTLAAAGLRVPQVLAATDDGFVMRDLGAQSSTGLPAAPVDNLGSVLEKAVAQGPQAVLWRWQQGWQALRQVHTAGQCLSQAFARNLVLCPDGVVGFIDFEDDPAAHLALSLCQLRDALCYLHSTAWVLERVQALPAGQQIWDRWQQGLPQQARQALQQALQRLRVLRHLPTSRRLGRDAQRLRLAWQLLVQEGR